MFATFEWAHTVWNNRKSEREKKKDERKEIMSKKKKNKMAENRISWLFVKRLTWRNGLVCVELDVQEGVLNTNV